MPGKELLVEEVAPAAESPSIIEGYRPRPADQPGDHETRLALARAGKEKGEFEAALDHCRRLVRSAALLDEVIADLVGVATERRDDRLTLTRLGDACIKDNRLQEALEAHREALAKF